MTSLFNLNGVHCLVDGQFGSTGKGALAAWLAHQAFMTGAQANFGGCIYSGGPNSGHTSFFEDEKIVLKQLPTFGVHLHRLGRAVPIYLSAGAVIDRDILREEAQKFPDIPIFVHPNATIVTDEDRWAEESKLRTIAEVAGTRSGTGAALIRKLARDPKAIAANSLGLISNNVAIQRHRLRPDFNAYFMEVSQGFSLGIHSQFYPKVTSRECTVMQGMADARLPASALARTYMAIRTYPIRVGNVDGFSSGDWYEDQRELSWEEIGVKPERTTVTNRVRRVATFSQDQLYEAFHANDPDFVFISHMDYLKPKEARTFIDDMTHVRRLMCKDFGIILGWGPKVTDIHPPVFADKNNISEDDRYGAKNADQSADTST